MYDLKFEHHIQELYYFHIRMGPEPSVSGTYIILESDGLQIFYETVIIDIYRVGQFFFCIQSGKISKICGHIQYKSLPKISILV